MRLKAKRKMKQERDFERSMMRYCSHFVLDIKRKRTYMMEVFLQISKTNVLIIERLTQ